MNIRVDLTTPITDGTEVVFRSPVDCSQVTGLKVYSKNDGSSKEFAFADAHGNNVGDIDHLFAENVVVKVILDVTTGMAFVQNADTNAYIERTFIKTVNGVAPDENGNVEVQGGGASVYVQEEEPSDAPVGTLWYDTDEESSGGGNGDSGEPGADGFSPIANVTQTGSGAVISITDKSGTTTAAIFNGKDGKDGKDGYTPVKGVDYFDGAPGKDGSDGKDGSPGTAGKDGTSVTVQSIAEMPGSGGLNVVTFSDGKTLTVRNGKDGEKGEPGNDGESATHSWNGTKLTITSASGSSSADLKGDKGDTGAQGNPGKDGADGAPGASGKDGVSATHSWNGTTLTITSASGTSSANLKGEKGDKGDQGIQGIQGIQGVPGDKGDKGDKGDTGAPGSNGTNGTSVTVKSVSESTADGGSNVVTFSDGKTVTIKNGSKGSKGDAYTLNDTDKATIVNAVIAALPVYAGEVV